MSHLEFDSTGDLRRRGPQSRVRDRKHARKLVRFLDAVSRAIEPPTGNGTETMIEAVARSIRNPQCWVAVVVMIGSLAAIVGCGAILEAICNQ